MTATSQGQGNAPRQQQDLDCAANIRLFVTAFYSRLLRDKKLADIFLEVARIDLNKHLPIICSYWEKLLLGGDAYRRHTMNIHRALHLRRPLREHEFRRWRRLFCATVDAHFGGPYSERAKRVASTIAANMKARMEELEQARGKASQAAAPVVEGK